MTHSLLNAYALPVPDVSLLPHVQLFTVCVGDEVNKKRGNNQYITSDSFNDFFLFGGGGGFSTRYNVHEKKKNQQQQ